jgi:hypothetical protein
MASSSLGGDVRPGRADLSGRLGVVAGGQAVCWRPMAALGRRAAWSRGVAPIISNHRRPREFRCCRRLLKTRTRRARHSSASIVDGLAINVSID